MKNVLFICTGNVFRSFSAERLLKAELEKHNDKTIIVDSAGTHGYPESPYPETIARLEMHGANGNGHHNKPVTQKHVERADIIICMTQQHVDTLKEKFGVDSYLFYEIATGEKKDLKDDNEAYGEYDDIEQFVDMTVDTIAKYMPAVYEKIATS